MSTITRDRLLKIQQWRETYGPGSNVVLPAEEAEELARIALASLEAEPVADVVTWSHPTEERTCDIRWRRFDVTPGLLYTAAPAPVVPDELLSAMEEVLRISDRDHDVWSRAKSAIADCRAAILPGAEPVTTAYKLPMQPLVIDAHGTLRFKENPIIRKLLDYATGRGYGLNEMALEHLDAEDRMQLAQLIGYSLSGYGSLSYVTDESYKRAAMAAPQQEVKNG